MTENQRSQFDRYDLREKRPRMTEVSEGGQRFLAILTVVFVVVLGALTYAAIQVFDGWAHLVVIADLLIIFFAIAAWIYSTRGSDSRAGS